MPNGVVDAEESVPRPNTAQDLSTSTTAHLQFRTEIKQEPPRTQTSVDTGDNSASATTPHNLPVSCPAPAPREESTPVTRLPALRIAPFAKESALNAHEAAISIPTAATKHHLRIANVQTTCDMIQPRKPYTRAAHAVGVTNCPKEMVVQPRVSNLQTAHLRLKNMPMRKTPYALRPERLLPGPEYAADYNAFENYVNSAASNTQLRQPTKRALHSQSTPVVVKKRRRQFHDDDWSAASVTAEEEDEAESDEDWTESSLPGPGVNGAKKTHLEKELFNQLLKEFSISLRDMQHELIGDFFTHQMQLARKEHEFQMKQDLAMLQAFKKQTDEVLATMRTFMNGRGKECKEQACQTEPEVNCHADLATKEEQHKLQDKHPESKITRLHNGHDTMQAEHTEDDDSDSEDESTDDSSDSAEEQQKDCKRNNFDHVDNGEDEDDDEDDEDNAEGDAVENHSSPHFKETQMLKFNMLQNRNETNLM